MDGKLEYVTMTEGDARLTIGHEDFVKGRDRSKGTGMRMWLTIKEDLNVVAARIKAAGYKLDEEPTKMPWGAVVFSISDPDGFKFSFDNPR